jgi:hypothetical protein
VPENPADIANHGLGRQRSVGDDLRHPLTAVLVGDVLDDPVAAFHAKIDIEIRHGHAFRIEEPLEQ